MDAQELRNLSEAYMEVYQELDEAKVEKDLSPSEKEDVRNVRAFGSTFSKNRATGMRRTFHAAERGVKKEPATGNEKSEISGRFGTGAEVRQKIRALKDRKSGRDFAKKVKQELEAKRYIKQQNSDFAAKNAENKISKFRREEVDLYDIILSHLLDEGYAETPEAAEAIMVSMSEEWRESIVEGEKVSDTLPDGKGGYKTVTYPASRAKLGGVPGVMWKDPGTPETSYQDITKFRRDPTSNPKDSYMTFKKDNYTQKYKPLGPGV